MPTPRALASTLGVIATTLVLVLVPDALVAYGANLGPLRSPGEPAFIAAHRGDRAEAPENTMPAIDAALRSGRDFVETDVRLTADGYPVLMHDETVDRTTDGSGRVQDLTLEQVRSLDAGSWFAVEYTGTPVPLFSEFAARLAASPESTALIELKGTWHAGDFGGLLRSIYLAGVQDRVVFASFSPVTLANVRFADPAIPRVIIRRVLPLDPVRLAERYGAMAIMTRPSALEDAPDAVAEMHAAGLGLLLYTLNSEDRWQEALALGVDGIVTDEPSELDAWIAVTAPGT